jgi:UrcA family protein
MTDFASKISGVAMLALAVLPIAALSTAAHAETRVHVADLNLLTPEGMATFNQRADRAARNYCSDVRGLGAAASCRHGVKAELNDKVAVIRAARLEQAGQTFAAR